jgi:hypothetical protein
MFRISEPATKRENIMSRKDQPARVMDDRVGDANRDPITGEPGAHPVGTGVGAAMAGAAAGAAGGLIGGPVGAAIGAVVGGVAGGLAGKGVAEQVDPTVEDAFWRENYSQRPYYDPKASYDVYAPAYKYGWESRSKYGNRTFDDAETELRKEWELGKSHTALGWDRAKHATRDAWDRIANSSTGNSRGLR